MTEVDTRRSCRCQYSDCSVELLDGDEWTRCYCDAGVYCCARHALAAARESGHVCREWYTERRHYAWERPGMVACAWPLCPHVFDSAAEAPVRCACADPDVFCSEEHKTALAALAFHACGAPHAESGAGAPVARRPIAELE